MTAKEYFRTLSIMEGRLMAKKERLEMMRELAGSVSGMALTGMPRSPSPNQSQTADAVCRVIALEEEVKADEERLVSEKTKALDMIGELENPDYQFILMHRYMQKESWEDIQQKSFYSKRWLLELHKRAMQSMDRVTKHLSARKST